MKNTATFAKELDRKDPLKSFRNQFVFPKHKGKQAIYFCGNSLGLQPSGVKKHFETELNSWAQLGVEGHFRGNHPWLYYHKMFATPLAALTGGLSDEVIAMNSLTVNLHLLLATFYRPTKKKFIILTEANSFSSDIYALKSQVLWHGYSPEEVIVQMKPRKGEECLRTDDILKYIRKHKKHLALVMMGGVNYYTGQLFDMKSITKEAHKAGAYAGFDLAHAIGNVELKLHEWKVDFAMWCSYKYLNAGPGATGGAFIHERHAKNKNKLRLAGWWGHQEKNRFDMDENFIPEKSAEGWQLSNAPVFNMIALKVSLDIFQKAGLKKIWQKSQKLTAYLEYCLKEENKEKKNKKFTISIITPEKKSERGAQLSLKVEKNAPLLFDLLTKQGFIVDFRKPSVIRIAPVPLYNSYADVYEVARLLGKNCFIK